jgi:hypothetical protein
MPVVLKEIKIEVGDAAKSNANGVKPLAVDRSAKLDDASDPALARAPMGLLYSAAIWILKSSIFFPDLSCSASQRGCLPRPAQVSAGSSGLRNLGTTGGYRRRSDIAIRLSKDGLALSCSKRSSSNSLSAANLTASASPISTCRFHKSSVDIRSRSRSSMTIPNHDSNNSHDGSMTQDVKPLTWI